ncbi:hypothetical protein [Alkalihalobacterium alkalinitrilicum]|uniref:hypothetical protein n=1 Tax=Alkalihalobacterium alkalinitrilicum TaxID=427920 RepID=UPI000994EE12|nr:hypothetical protein [Alkalihalobacterium alkalinitrilicum]
MDKQILDLLTEMSKEMKSMKSGIFDFKTEMKSIKSDIYNFKSEMHNRFDTIEAKLEGVGGQFELTNESRIIDVDFIADKVSKLERELYILKNKNNN